MNILQMILEILSVATGAAQVAGGSNPDVAAGAALAAALESIATKAVAAYEAQTGTPLDLTKLHPETEIPLP